MSSIDRTLHKKTFNAFEYNVTKYTARTSDVGDEVEKNWVDLGIYGENKSTHTWTFNKRNEAFGD